MNYENAKNLERDIKKHGYKANSVKSYTVSIIINGTVYPLNCWSDWDNWKKIYHKHNNSV